jgi:hypothetical protein
MSEQGHGDRPGPVKHRVWICTAIALVSGLFGAYVGGQMTWLARTQTCGDRPEALGALCRAWMTPGSVWEGSIAGLWTGTISGAFFAGLATRRRSPSPPEDSAADPGDDEQLRRVHQLVDALAKPTQLTDADADARSLSLPQLLYGIGVVVADSPDAPQFNRDRVLELCRTWGYPPETVEAAWRAIGDRAPAVLPPSPSESSSENL